ncbi:5371_t:CDS:2 [Acaulospora colombiana]|uniref:5371_t:CDS:1 n=1 Tax=Acaulospora colombiana TaxID=27376 RepID=A0ACA9QBD4_9GLOM|nr:5371_t:CDS:2 [Acaulospora colombiana]
MAGVSLFNGWTPRKVKSEDVIKLMDGDINPFTNRPLSASYKAILEKRKNLPVYGYMKEFYKIFNEAQITVMVGETGEFLIILDEADLYTYFG